MFNFLDQLFSDWLICSKFSFVIVSIQSIDMWDLIISIYLAVGVTLYSLWYFYLFLYWFLSMSLLFWKYFVEVSPDFNLESNIYIQYHCQCFHIGRNLYKQIYAQRNIIFNVLGVRHILYINFIFFYIIGVHAFLTFTRKKLW